jgi:hypothetical protein
LILSDWPPTSPDLNPLEMIWAIVKPRVEKDGPETKEELQKVITAVWSELNQEPLDHMVLSFAKRLAMVIQAPGRSIFPCL